MGSNETESIETCNTAMNTAIEKGLEYCDTEAARVEALGRLAGVDGSDIDADEVLAEGPGDGAADVQTRQWVVARANEIVESDGDDPISAINQAWGEVSDTIGSHSEEEAEEVDEVDAEGEAEEADGADADDEGPDPDESLDADVDPDADDIVEELTDGADEGEA